MITEVITFKAKFILGTLMLGTVAVADAGTQAWSPEDISFKAAAVLIILSLGKVIKSQWDTERKLREDHTQNLLTVIQANTASNNRVCEMAEEQAVYFKTVTRDIVNDRLHSKPEIP